MRWFRQVLHVAAKDLAYAKWLFVAYAIVTAITTMVASGWLHTSVTPWNLTVILVPLPMCLAAVVILTDSPVRADAFWVTQPFDPSAVAVAKALTVAVGILAPGIIGQFVTLMAFNIPSAQVPGFLGASIASEGSLVLLAMAIATVVPDFRAFLVAIALFVVVSQIAGALETEAFGPLRVSPSVIHLVALATNGVVVALAAYQYMAVSRRGSWKMGALAGVLLLSVPPLRDSSPALIRQRESAVVANSGRDSLSVVNVFVNQDKLEIAAIDRGASANERVLLTSARLTIERADGRGDTVPMGGSLTLHDPHLDLGYGVDWLGLQTLRTDSSLTSFDLTSDQADALLNRRATLRIEGIIEADSQRVAATVPLRQGATARMPGTIYQIDSARVRAEPLLTLHSSTVRYDEDDVPYWRSPQYVFAVVEPGLKQAVVFSSTGSSGGSSSFPMLGVTAATVGTTMHPDFPLRQRAGIVTDAWMRQAQLAIIEFVPVRSDSASLVVKGVKARVHVP